MIGGTWRCGAMPRNQWLAGGLLVLILLAAGGCALSPQEKRGISPIPQNRPMNWENRPFST